MIHLKQLIEKHGMHERLILELLESEEIIESDKFLPFVGRDENLVFALRSMILEAVIPILRSCLKWLLLLLKLMVR